MRIKSKKPSSIACLAERAIKKLCSILSVSALSASMILDPMAAFARDQRGLIDLCGFMAFTPAVAAGAGIVESIEAISISLAATAGTGTDTISTVATSRSIVVYGGATCNTTSDSSGQFARLELTDPTTVTATRTNTTGDLVIKGYVIQFKSAAVNSVQQGTILMDDVTSNTATISAVTTSTSAAFNTGFSGDGTSGAEANYLCNCELTNSTTVTVARATASLSSVDATVAYAVVDFVASNIASIQHVTVTVAAASSGAATIISVDTTKTWTAWGGFLSATADPENWAHLFLTNGTTYTVTHSNTASSTYKAVAIEFASGVLTSIQRNVVSLPYNVTSATDTISAVDTAKTVVTYTGNRGDGDNPAEQASNVVLTDSTTVTVAKAATSVTTTDNTFVAYEAAEWVI